MSANEQSKTPPCEGDRESNLQPEPEPDKPVFDNSGYWREAREDYQPLERARRK